MIEYNLDHIYKYNHGLPFWVKPFQQIKEFEVSWNNHSFGRRYHNFYLVLAFIFLESAKEDEELE